MCIYLVINWCEYDGFLLVVEVFCNVGCYVEGGIQDVWLIWEVDGDIFIDVDNNFSNGFLLVGI